MSTAAMNVWSSTAGELLVSPSYNSGTPKLTVGKKGNPEYIISIT